MERIVPVKYVLKRLFDEGYEKITMPLLKEAGRRIEDTGEFFVEIDSHSLVDVCERYAENLDWVRNVITQNSDKHYNPNIHVDGGKLIKGDLELLAKVDLSRLEE